MDGTEEVLINDSGTSKKFSTQRFLDVKTDCQTAETNASNSAVAAAASAASAASVYDTFDDRYLGTKASDPTTDNDGDALVQGMLYFDSTNNLMKVYDGSSWITTSSATLATLDVYKFTATSGQTVFTGTDDDSNTLAIKPTAEMVVMNGIVLEPTTDYTVTETTLTLTSGAALNDEVNVYAFGNFELADHYNKVASDARYYTKTELDAGQLDNRYFTETEADNKYLQDSEVTNLAQVKAFNSADYATAAQGTTADAALPKAGGTLTGDLSLGDNVKAKFGASDDLQIYHDGSNTRIVEGGTGSLIIQSNQLVFKSANDAEILGYSDENGAFRLYYDNSTKLATTSTGIDVTGRITTDAITEDTSGNVGIGTSSPSAKLDLKQTDGTPSTGFKIRRYNNDNQYISQWTVGGGMYFDVVSDYQPSMIFRRSLDSGSTFNESLRIDSSGNVGIGTSSPSEKLYVSGNIYATGNITAYSDERIKENIQEIPNALDAVDNIRGVSYTRTDTEEDGVGVIAQEVEAMFPELVTENNEGMKSVNYNGLVGVLFSAVKELSAKVKELEAK